MKKNTSELLAMQEMPRSPQQKKMDELVKILVEKEGKLMLGKKSAAYYMDTSTESLDRLRRENKIASRKIRGQIKICVSELARFIVEGE